MKNRLDYKIADLSKKEDFFKLQVGDIVKYITPYKEEGERIGVVTSKDSDRLCITRRDIDSFGRKGILQHVFELRGEKIIDYGRANNSFSEENSAWRYKKEEYASMDEFLKGQGL
jgi:hypothetical protein